MKELTENEETNNIIIITRQVHQLELSNIFLRSRKHLKTQSNIVKSIQRHGYGNETFTHRRYALIKQVVS